MTKDEPKDLMSLPQGLPVPADDGACDHLVGASVADVELMSTAGSRVRLARLFDGCDHRAFALFFYPRTGVPGQPPGLGFAGETWESIPGARGCTPQSCGFRDHYAEFLALKCGVYGVSTNTPSHQTEFKLREHVPFEFLSDSDLALTSAMRLPTFRWPVESGGPNTLLRRMVWLVTRGPAEWPRIERVLYPVFPPDTCASLVLEWCKTHWTRS